MDTIEYAIYRMAHEFAGGVTALVRPIKGRAA